MANQSAVVSGCRCGRCGTCRDLGSRRHLRAPAIFVSFSTSLIWLRIQIMEVLKFSKKGVIHKPAHVTLEIISQSKNIITNYNYNCFGLINGSVTALHHTNLKLREGYSHDIHSLIGKVEICRTVAEFIDRLEQYRSQKTGDKEWQRSRRPVSLLSRRSCAFATAH